MSKGKLARFADNKVFENVIQPTRNEIFDGLNWKGKWNEKFFKNQNPIIIELGCGKGEYSVELARNFPDKNFIGIDIKGARLWAGAKQALAENLSNVAFLRTQIELIDLIFDTEEVAEIWITFPDPQIKYRRAKLRLTHPKLLEKYKKVLKKNGLVHLKTDSEFLHGYTNGILYAMNCKVNISQHDVYKTNEEDLPFYVKSVQTFYEKMFLKEGKKITYLQFEL